MKMKMKNKPILPATRRATTPDSSSARSAGDQRCTLRSPHTRPTAHDGDATTTSAPRRRSTERTISDESTKSTSAFNRKQTHPK